MTETKSYMQQPQKMVYAPKKKTLPLLRTYKCADHKTFTEFAECPRCSEMVLNFHKITEPNGAAKVYLDRIANLKDQLDKSEESNYNALAQNRYYKKQYKKQTKTINELEQQVSDKDQEISLLKAKLMRYSYKPPQVVVTKTVDAPILLPTGTSLR